MAVEIVVPVLGESVTEATVAQWLKKPGEAVAQDEPLVELETDKVTLEVGAPANGVVAAVSAEEGATVEVGAVLGLMEEGDAPAAAAPAPAPTAMQQPTAEVSAAPMRVRVCFESLAPWSQGPRVKIQYMQGQLPEAITTTLH